VKIDVRFGEAGRSVARSVDVECVFDRAPFGDLLGVEILSPAWFAGVPGETFDVQPPPEHAVRMSYDYSADALSLHFRGGHSRDQPLGTATMAFDDEGHLVRISARSDDEDTT
jgi:hypothetical protein